MTLTYNHGPDSEEHKGIFLEESLHVLLGDLLYFPLGFHGAYVNIFSETLHPAAGNQNMSPCLNTFQSKAE